MEINQRLRPRKQKHHDINDFTMTSKRANLKLIQPCMHGLLLNKPFFHMEINQRPWHSGKQQCYDLLLLSLFEIPTIPNIRMANSTSSVIRL